MDVGDEGGALPPPVDLARERRKRAAFSELEAIGARNPGAVARALSRVDEGENMAKSTTASDQPYAVRLRDDEVARIEALQARIERKARSGADVTLTALGRTSRASVLRLAVLRGLAALEADYPEAVDA